MNTHYDPIDPNKLITLTAIDEHLLDIVKTQSPEVLTAWIGLTYKQQQFLLNIIQDMPHYKAYQLAYNLPPDNRRSLDACASIALRGAKIRTILASLYSRRDNDLQRVLNVFLEATEATKDAVTVDSDGVQTAVKVSDHLIRLKAAEGLARLHALNAPAKVQVDVRSTVIRYHRPEREAVDSIDVTDVSDIRGEKDLVDPDDLKEIG